MYCRSCGRELEDGASFCPECGFPTDPAVTVPRASSGRPSGGRVSITRVVLVVFVLLSVSLLALCVTNFLNQENAPQGMWVSDDVYATGALADGTFTVSEVDDHLEFTFADAGMIWMPYTWHFVDRDGTDATYSSTWPDLRVPLDELPPGEYLVWVEGTDVRDDSPSRSAEGGLKIYGTVTDTFRWEYMGRGFSATVSYEMSEYDERSAADGYLRTYGDFGERISELTTPDPTVASLEAGLRSAYLEAYGRQAPVDGQAYADFVLAFVQICFAYIEDETLYDSLEYWAYPLETIYHGGGDCEDTSFLCAALLDAAGYDSGVFMVPGHALAAVSLDAYSDGLGWGGTAGLHIYSYEHDGGTYYGCETTVDIPIPAGIVSRDYTITPDGRFQYMGEGDEPWDGLYIIG